METQFATGVARGDDGFAVGREAAGDALADFDTDRVDFCQVFSSALYDYEAVLDGIRDVVGPGAALIGCSSAGEFTEDGSTAKSVTVSLVASDSLQFFTNLGTGMDETLEGCVREAVSGLPRHVDGYPYKAAITLHDGLAGVGETTARLTKQKLGPHIPLAGGSAGDDLQLEATHVFEGDRVAQNAIAVALVASESRIPVTVDHGHRPISDPVTVTRAEGSVVHQLDGEPAFEVWQDLVRESAQERYDVDVDDLEDGTETLSEMLTRYEFGIAIDDESTTGGGSGIVETVRRLLGVATEPEYKIRWPGLTTTTDGPLQFAVGIDEGTEMRAMHSGERDQIRSVRQAAKAAVDSGDDIDVAGAFVYDCVCRAAILEDQFDQSVEAIDDELGAPFAGFETYGEVCMHMGDMSGYHNTTSVVMVLPK